MLLIAGLGNPEKKYAGTRHNVGFEASEILRLNMGWGPMKTRFHSEFVQGKIGGEPCLLCRPLTYMNNSGLAIREIADFYKIDPANIVVLYDDVALPLGALRVRGNGSAGGHNGIKSIIAHLGTQDFPRVRIGVGEKPAGWDLADYVLEHFHTEEIPIIREACERAAQAVEVLARDGLAKAMNQYNQKPAAPATERAERP
jgi:PTH1 family peptidyl-tRNA hydrolase